ncbi:hypothetical protein HID58_004831 [Brassica napus]|jgi:hypothetical protein
MGHG